MKERASRNRTLNIHEGEQNLLINKTISLSSRCRPEEIENKLIYQDLFSCIDFLPDEFIDLLIVDPPYNLNKKFGNGKFAKTSAGSYEEWIDSWMTKLKRCLRRSASLYVCCDWQSSKSIQSVLEKYFVIRSRITWEREKRSGGPIQIGRTVPRTYGSPQSRRHISLTLMQSSSGEE